jgi:hypothetical protein
VPRKIFFTRFFQRRNLVAHRKSKFLSFPAFKKAVRALGIRSVKELKQRLEEIVGAPSNPNVIYADKGWKGYADLFGKNGVRGGKPNTPRRCPNRPTQHHGESRNGKQSPEFRAWNAMMGRCFCLNHSVYEYYGARGVTVCERWRTFVNFLADLGRKPTERHSLGRVGDVGNYEPGNARWMSRKEQSAEKRKKYATRHYISKYRPTPQLRTPEQLPLAA